MSSVKQNLAQEILEVAPKIIDYIRSESRSHPLRQLTIAQFRALNYLSKKQSVTNTDLAKWMGIAAPTLTRMMDALSKKRLVKRKKSLSDRRQIQFVITSAGWDTIKSYYFKVQSNIEDRVQSLSDLELNAVLQGLMVLKKIV